MGAEHYSKPRLDAERGGLRVEVREPWGGMLTVRGGIVLR